MRPVMIWCSVILGVILGVGARWYVHHNNGSTSVGGHIQRQSHDVSGTNRSGTVAWSITPQMQSTSKVTEVVIAPVEGDLGRIAYDLPRLFLEDEDGGRAVALTYYIGGDGLLHLTKVDGLRQSWYTALIALYDDAEQDLMPIDVDLRGRP